MQGQYWMAAVAFLGLAVASGFAEHRRRRRADLDRVGVVPWPLVQMMALLGALITASLAIHLG